MIEVTSSLRIPVAELHWQFVRAGGPGGQNVNKVATKAVLHWDVASSPSVPDEVKARLRTLQRNRITREGVLVLSSQRFRDQVRNRQDCLEKLSHMLLQAATKPKPRKKTKPSRGSHEARLRMKKHQARKKEARGRIEDH